MSQIKEDKITMRARWLFLAKKIGLQSGLALTILVLVFLINAFFFYIKSNNILPGLHFGSALWQKILHSLPYDLILIIVILLLILNYAIKKFDFSYKRPFAVIFTTLILFIILWASLLSASNLNHTLRGHFIRTDIHIPYLSDFYVHRCCQHDQTIDNCINY